MTVVISGHAGVQAKGHYTPAMNSVNVSSYRPMTPIAVDKGKRKAFEYNTKSDYTSRKQQQMPSGTCYVSDDRGQELLCMLLLLVSLNPLFSFKPNNHTAYYVFVVYRCNSFFLTNTRAHNYTIKSANGYSTWSVSSFSFTNFISVALYSAYLTLPALFGAAAPCASSSNTANDQPPNTMSSSRAQGFLLLSHFYVIISLCSLSLHCW